VTTTPDGGRDDTPVRRQQFPPPPTFAMADRTPNADLIAFVARCDTLRKAAAWRLPPYRNLVGLAGRDPLAWEWRREPSTFGLEPDELIAEAERVAGEGWSDSEIVQRFAVVLR
jgi:hypothetical protein